MTKNIDNKNTGGAGKRRQVSRAKPENWPKDDNTLYPYSTRIKGSTMSVMKENTDRISQTMSVWTQMALDYVNLLVSVDDPSKVEEPRLMKWARDARIDDAKGFDPKQGTLQEGITRGNTDKKAR
jgi:hypothetical protein